MAMTDDERKRCLKLAGRLSFACGGLHGSIFNIGDVVMAILAAKKEYDDAIYAAAFRDAAADEPAREEE